MNGMRVAEPLSIASAVRLVAGMGYSAKLSIRVAQRISQINGTIMGNNQKVRAIAVLLAAFIALTGCSRGPKDISLVEKGNKLLAKKDYARATLEFRSAIQANPKNFEGHYGLALAEIGVGDKIAAYRALSRALDLNPQHTGAQIQMADLLVTSRSPEEVRQAEEHAKAVLEGSPDNPDALDTMATAELRLGKRDEALELLERASSKA